MTSRRLPAVLILALLTMGAGCPSKGPVKKPRAAAKRATVAVYTESAPVNAVTPLANTLWVATGQGLVAWDIKGLKAKVMTVDDGLPGNNILTLAGDGKKTLWVGTATGIARLREGRWTQFGDCPLGDAIQAMATTADGDTVWVGGPKGLAHLQGDKWKMLYNRSEVTALHFLNKEDVLWVGTRKDGALRCQGTKCEQFGVARLGARHVTALAQGPAGVLALLRASKRDLLAYRYKGRWHQYTLKPRVSLDWASFAQGTLYLAAGGRVYRLTLRTETETPAGPIELDPLTSGAPEFISHKVKREFPRRVTVVKQALGSLWIGSKRLGVARFNGDLLQYFRTNDLTDKARRLSLACTDRKTCYLATGNRLYRKRGDSMSQVRYPADNDAVFQWVGRGPSVQLLTVLRSGQGALQVVRMSKAERFTALELKPPIFTKKGPLQATFVKRGPGGKLWIGLAIEEADDTRGAGLAVVDLATGAVEIHGRGAGLPVTEGALGITSDLSGAAFHDGQAFIGSRNGVIRIARNRAIRVFTENDGLKSEIVHQLALGPTGRVYAATASGLGIYDGAWTFPDEGDARSERASSLVRASDGTLWFGGAQGLHRLKKGKLTTFNTADGLLQNGVLSVAVDARGRVWAMHKNGLSIVKPRI